MSDKSTAYLRLSKQEARALIGWFIFQEMNHVDDGEQSSIEKSEIDLLNKIKTCIKQINKNPSKHPAIRLAPTNCRMVLKWYSNLPECLLDDMDANIHANVGMFLDEYDNRENK